MKKYNIYLDSTYAPPADKNVIFVFDVRVAVYNLLKTASELRDISLLPYLVQYYVCGVPWKISQDWQPGQVRLMFVDDQRTNLPCGTYNYWRDQWLSDNFGSEFPGYKGQRGVNSEEDRPEFYTEVLHAINEYARITKTPYYRQAGIEADDWAGSIWRYADNNPDFVQKNQVILCTVDNDWGQLVSDELDIIFYVTGSFKAPISRLRSGYEMLVYYNERHMANLTDTRQIVDYKVEYGDSGDNIIPGSPREIIDLCYPPVTPDISELYTELAKDKPGREVKANAALVAAQKINLI